MGFHICIVGYLLGILVLPLCEAHLMIRFLLSSLPYTASRKACQRCCKQSLIIAPEITHKWSAIIFSLRNLPTRAFDFHAQGLGTPLARRRSSYPPPSPNLVRTRPIEHYKALRDSTPCLSRAATLPKGTKLELGRGAHLGSPSSGIHTAAVSQPTGRIAKAASWLHLSRVSLALHPSERPSHTHTPKPDFGGRGHEV